MEPLTLVPRPMRLRPVVSAAGEGPVRSPAVGGVLVAVDEGRWLRIADDETLTSFWRTPEETERAAKEAALAKIAELEAQLRRSERG